MEYSDDTAVAIFRAVKETHDQKHELPFTACTEDVCGELKYDEVAMIQGASQDNWERHV